MDNLFIFHDVCSRGIAREVHPNLEDGISMDDEEDGDVGGVVP